MSQISEIYKGYSEKETRGEEPERLGGSSMEIEALSRSGKQLSVSPKMMCAGYVGTYLLPDGRVMEMFWEYAYPKAFAWPNEAAHAEYHRPLPRNIYFEW